MSEANFSIRSRRSSTVSKCLTSYSDENYNVNCFKKPDWFKAFLYFKENAAIFIDDNEYLMDTLKLFFDDSIPDNVIIHLLSLLENYYYIFKDLDLLEQVIGSLLNAYSNLKNSDQVKKKYLFTIITLLISNNVNSNLQIKSIYDSIIKILINNLKSNFLIQESNECLNQIEILFPGTINEFCLEEELLNKNLVTLTYQIILNKKFNTEDITEITEKLLNENENPLTKCRALIIFFEFIKNNSYQILLSPNFFKPFLTDLTYSSELNCFHLALNLLLNFDLTFTFYEEQDLINQLFTLCIHPSLITSHRLMILDFAETFIQLPKIKNNLNFKKFEICDVLDGPDTQEKKLKILLNSNIEDENLLFNLKPLKNLCLLKNNKRASNSLYRILNSVIKKRISMQSKIEYLILSLILNCPSQHISRVICLLKLNPSLTQNFLNLIIEETNNHFDNFQDENDLKQYFLAFEWILNQTELDEKNILIILNFVIKKSENRSNLFKGLLNCCAAIICKQRLSKKIKSIINDALNYLSIKGKNNLELSSWTQIYLITINTLPNQENVKKVLDGIELFKNQVFTDTFKKDKFPLKIERIKQRASKKIDTLNLNNLNNNFLLSFTISIDERFVKNFPNLFCIEIIILCNNHCIESEKAIAHLQSKTKKSISFEIKLNKIENFDVNIGTRFTDLNGIIYTYYDLHEHIIFRELLQPLSITYMQFEQMWNLYLNEEDDKIIKNLISLPEYKTNQEFFQHFTWIQNFTIKRNRISFLVPNSNIVLIKVVEVNDMVNLRIITNNLNVLNKLNKEFSD